VNDAIWSFHLNPMTCGVARFNQQLAERLGTPFEAIAATDRAYPLISIKPSEIPGEAWLWPYKSMDYDLFLHDFTPESMRDVTWASFARRIYAANELIAMEVEQHANRSVTVAWCPSLVKGNTPHGDFRVVMFGMGHKRQIEKLQRLKRLLDATRWDYTVDVSTGIHEGSPWDQAWRETESKLRGLFGSRLRLLGYLADDALVDVLGQAHLAALFYEDGVRANNTTLWAAMDAGVPVLTNLDAASPLELNHRKTVLDLSQTRSLVHQPLAKIGEAGRRVALQRGWPRLLSVLVA
jgi:hypothetical protein